MCTDETIAKLDSGKFIAVPKWKHHLSLWSPLIGIVMIIVLVTSSINSATDRMFNNAEQKFETVKHSKDSDIHMKYKEKIKEFVTRKEYEALLKRFDVLVERLDRYLTNKGY